PCCGQARRRSQEKGIPPRMKRPAAAPAVPLSDIAAAVGGRQVGADTSILGVSSLDEACACDLAYVESDRFIDAARASRASAFLVDQESGGLGPARLVVSDA